MINDNILIFIISIVLIYVFDHKILPTIGTMTFTLIELYLIVVVNASIFTETDVLYVFLFAVSLIYGAFMIVAAPTEINGNYDVVL